MNYNSNTLSHAFIFIIENQSEVYKFNDELILNLVCKNNKACKECSFCKKYLTNNLLNYFALSQKKQKIKKNEILSLFDFLSKSNAENNKSKFYSIMNIDYIDLNLANKLLKIIEEPVSDNFAFLFANNIDNVIPTIRSRCKIFFVDYQHSETYTNKLLEIINNKQKEQIFLFAREIKKWDKEKVINLLTDCLEKIKHTNFFILLGNCFLEALFNIKKFSNYNLILENLFIEIFEVL